MALKTEVDGSSVATGAAAHVRMGPEQIVAAGMRLALAETATLPGGPAPVRMSRFGLESGACSPVDVHDEREMWMIAQGAGLLTYRGQGPVVVRAGDVLAFDRQSSHTLLNTGADELVVFSIWWGSSS